MTALCRRSGERMKYNSVEMRGRIGHEPELRKTSTGKSVTNVSVAVYAGKDAQGNSKSEWFHWTLWDSKADEFCRTAHKGDTIHLEGKAVTEQGKTKGGELYTTVKFVAYDYEVTPKRQTVTAAQNEPQYIDPNSNWPIENEPLPF